MSASTVVVTYVGAASLNARALVFGGQPAIPGMVASAAYLASWLLHAFASGRRRSSGALRRMAVAWALVISGTVICGAFLRLNLGTGAAIPGGWVVPAILLLLAAPLYGLAGLFPTDPFVALSGVAFAGAALTMAIALAARRPR